MMLCHSRMVTHHVPLMQKDCSVQVLTLTLGSWNPQPAMQRTLSCVSFIINAHGSGSTVTTLTSVLLFCASLLKLFQCASKEITGVSPSQNYHHISMDTKMMTELSTFLPITKTCLMLPA